MKQFILQTGCEQFRTDGATAENSTATNALLAHIIRGCAHINDTTYPVYVDIVDSAKKTPNSQTDSGAVLYIVAVLVFYSFGIIIMIVKYLRREKNELEEERILDDFFRSMPEYKKEREQNKMNKVAIHAFHALTSYSENAEDDGSGNGEGAVPKKADTIYEEETECHLLNNSLKVSSGITKNVDDLQDTHIPLMNVTVKLVNNENKTRRQHNETHL